MAETMRAAVEAGRKTFLAGLIPKKLYATASSPVSDGLTKYRQPLFGLVLNGCFFLIAEISAIRNASFLLFSASYRDF